MKNNTSIPWRFEPYEGSHESAIIEDTHQIATVYYDDMEHSNAKHIVHCVNGHDELLKALGDCLDMLDLLLHTEEIKNKTDPYFVNAEKRYENNVFIEKKWK